ncbi:MAG: LLM class flavin-dependent oxidoreductase [Nocardiaceae bacterium]|nr:LLM class flavin-dependent oxidoreductase [Nocardiaceae bacterium]
MAFSFGLIIAPRTRTDLIRDVQWGQDNGYGSVMLPDTLRIMSPFPALAAAAAVTDTIKLRTNVVAAPYRTSAELVREVTAVQTLSDGRFELGIGVGRPDAEGEAAQLGKRWGMAGRRRAQLWESVAAVRESVQPVPPIIVAAAGPRMLSDAAEGADRILLAAGPTATLDDVRKMAAHVRRTSKTVGLSQSVFGVGGQVQAWIAARLAPDLVGLAGVLPADPAEAAETLESRREQLGIDEVLVPIDLAPAFAPVLELLS